MKISQQTIALLKQFAAINPGLVISPGNVIISRTPDLVAEVTVPETFPHEVRISNINEFLRAVALFRDPIYDFCTDHVRITESDGTAQTVYTYAKSGSILSVHTLKKKPLSVEQISLIIGPEHWDTLRKALGISISRDNGYGDGHLKIKSDGQNVQLVAERYSRTQTIEYSVSVPALTNGFECENVLDAHLLPSLPGPYELTVFPFFVRFQQRGDHSLLYYVASKPLVSTWGGTKFYQVKATKNLTQECVISVSAHSPQEAEALVRQMDTFDWTGEPCQRIVCTTLGS